MISAFGGRADAVVLVSTLQAWGWPLGPDMISTTTTLLSQRAEPSPLGFGSFPKRRMGRGITRISRVPCEKAMRGFASRVPPSPGAPARRTRGVLGGGSDPPPRWRTSVQKRGVAPSMMLRPARHLPDGGMARRAVSLSAGGVWRGSPLPFTGADLGILPGRPATGGGVPPLGERLRTPHHLGAPGTLRRMCAYLPAPLRPPEGESVISSHSQPSCRSCSSPRSGLRAARSSPNHPPRSPLRRVSGASLSRLSLPPQAASTLPDRVSSDCSQAIATPRTCRAPGPQPPPQVEVRLRSLFPTRFQPIQLNRFPHWISLARV